MVSYKDSRVGSVASEGLASTKLLTTGFAVMEAYVDSRVVGYSVAEFSVTNTC